MKKIALIAIIIFSGFYSNAQSKVGTIDSEFILSKMPELPKIQEDLNAYNKKLEDDLKVKVDQYQAKIEAYKTQADTYTDPMKKTKQEEIITLENDIAKFRQNGSKLFQIKQNQLLQPLYQKIGKTLEEIAKAEGYSQILTITSSGLAYIDPKFDLTKSVMSKLGIKVEE
ncbi:OmpH family outer membrane protein [Aquimarina sp. W85]|uniref:OmpH family outer membrane protein n=1 Tax=Aquimarina rhodophyticola TaxID=3342246 RepID=UPI0036709011